MGIEVKLLQCYTEKKHCSERDLCQQIYNLPNIYIYGKINNTKSDFRNP